MESYHKQISSDISFNAGRRFPPLLIPDSKNVTLPASSLGKRLVSTLGRGQPFRGVRTSRFGRRATTGFFYQEQSRSGYSRPQQRRQPQQQPQHRSATPPLQGRGRGRRNKNRENVAPKYSDKE